MSPRVTISICTLSVRSDLKITLYADDAVIMVSDPKAMSIILGKLSSWCMENSLTINETKTKWMLFHGKKNDNTVFKLNNIVLERVYTFKYLGVTIGPEFKFV